MGKKKNGKGKRKVDEAQAYLKRKSYWSNHACSSAWADTLAIGREQLPEGLIVCTTCNRHYPPHYVSDRTCLDCATHEMPAYLLAALPRSCSILGGGR